jgi:hypothetical protein
MCVSCLEKAAKHNILFREYLLTLPEGGRRLCIGKPGCKRWTILHDRCPDCLYDWQISIGKPRNFFKGLRWP